jgi:hypothetical protein
MKAVLPSAEDQTAWWMVNVAPLVVELVVVAVGVPGMATL